MTAETLRDGPEKTRGLALEQIQSVTYLRVFLSEMTVSLDNVVPIQRKPFIFTHNIKLIVEGIVVLHNIVSVDERHISRTIAKALKRPCKAIVRFLV